MKGKNQRLLLIFSLLLVLNIMLFFLGGKSRKVSFNEQLFAVEDTAGVDGINIITPSEEIVLSRGTGGWQLNGEFNVDVRVRRALMSILQRVVVKKPADVRAPSDQIQVRISGKNPSSFIVWGNPTKTKTYFSQQGTDEVYEVGLPGYHDYLGQVFELNADQWRDRLVFDGSWRTIQDLSLDYQNSGSKDFSIRFADPFFEVDGISGIDTTSVIDYLNQFQYFEINEWVSDGRFDRYDSLAKRPPMAILRIATINTPDTAIFRIYPNLQNEPYHLVSNASRELMIIDRQRMLGILRKKTDFMVND